MAISIFIYMKMKPQLEMKFSLFGIIQISAKGKEAIKQLVPKAIQLALIGGCTSVIVYVTKKEIAYYLNKRHQQDRSPTLPPTNPDEVFRDYKPSEAFDSKDSDLSPMVGYILPEGHDALVYGMKGTMKSYLVLGTMIQIGMGEYPQILPPDETSKYQPPTKVYCIYADGENGMAVIKDRYKSFGDKLDSFMQILEAKSFGNDMDVFFEKLYQMCSKLPDGTKVILGIDNIKSLLNDHSHNDGKLYLNKLKQLRERLSPKRISLTSITLGHTVKTGNKISGTYDLPCLTPYVFKIEPDHKFTIEESRTGIKGIVYPLKVMEDGYTRLAFCLAEDEPTEDANSVAVWNGKLSLEKTIEMKEFYDRGEPGRGLQPTAEKYGLKYAMNVTRELERLDKYLTATSETGEEE